MYLYFYRIMQATLLLTLMIAAGGCMKDSCNRRVPSRIYTPVYKSLADIRSAVKEEAPRAMEQPGKIYIYGRYIFLNELGEGIHVIDNSSPNAPKNIAFVNIPGNVDIAVKDNILYADSYLDLVALDISDPLHIQEVNRIQSAFASPGYQYGIYTDTTKGIIISFNIRDTVLHYSCKNDRWDGEYMYDKALNSVTIASNTNMTGPSATGKAGSTAKFGLATNYLYTVNNNNIQTFNVQQAAKPQKKSSVRLNLAAETIFPYNKHLFLGTTTGMAIYDINDPETPVFKSMYQHITGCDPVIVQDNLAYVTLRGGVSCNIAAANTLDVIDIKNPQLPSLLKSYPMLSPYGLGLDNNKLFVCEGPNGLTCLDATDPLAITTIQSIKEIKPFDIIPEGNDIVLVTAEDGLYQYNLKNPATPVLLSKLSVASKN
ncbi:hypothetical protein [Chitinophaga sp. MM2321]|uniref:LVIVD repeat-containing protein n=1 Tax=Chitinophaga sp. MM2321 TaxID=3137178 RepID=UPI0032D57D67